MRTISNRYVIEDSVVALNNGRLHKGKDLSLQRIVFLYIIPNQGVSFSEKYLLNLGNSVDGGIQSQFMQVLDVVCEDDHIYVILKYKEGRSLQQAIHKNQLDFQSAAALIADLGETLLHAAEERPIDFTLTPNNLWLDEDGRIMVINSWEKAVNRHRAAKDLSRLLYQLITHEDQIPSDPALLANQLNRELKKLPEHQREAAVTAVTNAEKELLSLAFFTQCLKDLLHDVQPPVHKEAQVQSRKAPVIVMPAKRIWKGVFMTVSLGALSLAIFVGVFALLIESTGHKKEIAETPDTAVQEPRTVAVAQTAPSQTPAPAPAVEATPVSLPDSADGVVPTLTGLSQEAAEKQAISSGLRYTYYLEENNEAPGTVFKQEPQPNAPAAKGDHITFWVSKGSKL